MKTFFVTILTAATFSTFALMAYGAQLDILEATHTDEISWIDIDGDNNADALTDGILILRSMFGIDSTALVSGALSTGATYSDPSDITYRISLLGDRLDIDGDGQIDALTDGLLILRYLFGLTGSSLTDSVISTCLGACEDRRSGSEIEVYLAELETRPPPNVKNIQETMRITLNGLDIITLETNISSSSLAYSVSGEDADYFLINTYGKLTFKEPHNYKIKTTYKIIINVDDITDPMVPVVTSIPTTLFIIVQTTPLYSGEDHWEPSRKGQCEYGENVSPALAAITSSLAAGTSRRAIYEPVQMFNDETTTFLVTNIDTDEAIIPLESESGSVHGIAAWGFHDEAGERPEYAYDDGTHGDLVAGDKVWTLACISPEPRGMDLDPTADPLPFYSYITVIRREYRGTEPSPSVISSSLSVNDTGFFYRNDQHFLINSDETAWSLADPSRSDALKQIWDYKGPIFNMYALNSNNNGWGTGMWRIHDFVGGLGHNPDCDNSPDYSSGSHCYSFVDGKDHPELMAGITIESNADFSGFTHEMEHALLGFTMRGFPEANPPGTCDQKEDCLGTSLSRELSTDFSHIEAATTLISTLKGPPWNPAFGAPASVRIGTEEQSVDGTIIYDDNDKKFKLVNRDNHYIVSDFVLYHMGLISKDEAMKDEYKIMNYSFPDCLTSSDKNIKTLFCPDNYEFNYDEYIKFNVSDSIAKFGEYSNSRELNIYDPANINVAVIHIGGRNHTEAEYILATKIYRTWARFDTSKVKIYFDRKKLNGDIPWSTSLGGLSRVNIDFSH